jgi:hypothetical protein
VPGQWSTGAPDSPVPYTGQFDAPQKRKPANHRTLSCPGRVLFTVWCAPDSPVHPRTEGNNGLPNGAPTAPSCLRAIKGTPRHMEQYTKPLLNILRRRDFAYTHLVHCDSDSSTSLSYNSAVLFRVLVLALCTCCCCNSRPCVC